MTPEFTGLVAFILWILCTFVFIFNPVLSGLYLAIINFTFVLAAIMSTQKS